MITVSISGRKATLLKTADLPSGNDNSINVNFIFSESDPVWKGARKIAMFKAVTPRGLKKALPAVINKDGECLVPGKILSTPFSKVFVGTLAAYEDGSTVSTNMVFVNNTGAGAGGDNIYDDEELPIDKNDFDMFLAELAASIGVQVAELSEQVSSLETLTESLEVGDDGKLTIDDEPVLDYATWFHRMTRYCDDFAVECYYELSAHDLGPKEATIENGVLTKHIKMVDLSSGTKHGDKAFVRYASGNYVMPNDISEHLGLIPELDVVYPYVHVWQAHLPKPADDEDKQEEAFVYFCTYSGERYRITRYYDETFGAWVVKFKAHNWDGIFYYSWVDTDVLEANNFVLIKDGEKIEHKDWPSYHWPVLIDVMCREVYNAEKLKDIFLSFPPINYHPTGSYVYDGNKKLWKIRTDTDWHSKFVITKDMWSFDRRRTLYIKGLVPEDYVHFTAHTDDGKNFGLKVVHKGYSQVTIECPEEFADYMETDLKISLGYRNLVERNDTFGLWSEW